MSEPEWKQRFATALHAGGCQTTMEWAERHPGEHCWFRFRDDTFNSCACCGVVERRDGKNTPCRGVVRVVLRGGA